MKWHYANYGNKKAEIQDDVGFIAIVKSPKLAKELCQLHNNFELIFCVACDNSFYILKTFLGKKPPMDLYCPYCQNYF